jgi:uncharacterized membrane protein YphA (DoxX/SURF4 family)
LVSVAVGVVLAGAYHYLSIRLQRWASQRSITMLPAVTIVGFVIRLAIFVGILVALGLWTPLNILALCLAFVVVFTVLNAVWLFIVVSKRHGAPPSAGASSVL